MRAGLRLMGLDSIFATPRDTNHASNPSAPILNVSSVEAQAPMSPESPFSALYSLSNNSPPKLSPSKETRTPNRGQSARAANQHHLRLPQQSLSQHRPSHHHSHVATHSAPTIPIPSVPIQKRFAPQGTKSTNRVTTTSDAAETSSGSKGDDDHNALIQTLIAYGIHTNDTAHIQQEEEECDETEDSESSASSYSTPSLQVLPHFDTAGIARFGVETVYLMLMQKAHRLKALKAQNDEQFARKCALFRRDLSKYKQTNQYLKTQNKSLKEDIEKLKVRLSTMEDNQHLEQLMRKRKQLPSRKVHENHPQLPNFVRKQFAKVSTMQSPMTPPSQSPFNSNGAITSKRKPIEPVKSTVVHLCTESNSCHIPNHPYFPAEPVRRKRNSNKSKSNTVRLSISRKSGTPTRVSGQRKESSTLHTVQRHSNSGTTTGVTAVSGVISVTGPTLPSGNSDATSSQLDDYNTRNSNSVPFIHQEISPVLTATSDISTSDAHSHSSTAHAVKVALPKDYLPDYRAGDSDARSSSHISRSPDHQNQQQQLQHHLQPHGVPHNIQHDDTRNTHSHSNSNSAYLLVDLDDPNDPNHHRLPSRVQRNPPPVSVHAQEPKLRVVKPPLPLTHMRQLTTIMEHTSIPLELIEQSLESMSREWHTPSVSTISGDASLSHSGPNPEMKQMNSFNQINLSSSHQMHHGHHQRHHSSPIITALSDPSTITITEGTNDQMENHTEEDTLTTPVPTPPTRAHVPTISYMSNNTAMLNELSLESSENDNLKAIIEDLLRMDSTGGASAAMSRNELTMEDHDVIQAPIGIMDNVFGVRL